jgi:hypothetical protein
LGRNHARMLSLLAASILVLFAAVHVSPAQGQRAAKDKQELKKVDKEARRLGDKAEEVARELGRAKVFCILAAHTDVASAAELKSKYEDLTGFPFGEFVAAVLMSDRTEIPLDQILDKLLEGMSLGKITKEANINMGEMRRGFVDFRSELARSLTNPPTRECLETTRVIYAG